MDTITMIGGGGGGVTITNSFQSQETIMLGAFVGFMLFALLILPFMVIMMSKKNKEKCD